MTVSHDDRARALERTRLPQIVSDVDLPAPNEPSSAGAAAPSVLAVVRERFERGQYLQALRAAEPLGPLRTWSTLEGLILAGRLAHQLGNEPLGARLHLRAHRLFPESGEAWLGACSVVWSRSGAYAAHRRVLVGAPPDTSPSDLLNLRTRLASAFRDFDEAERLHSEALALAPEDAWTVLHGAFIQAAADEHGAALDATDRALALRDWYRPAVDLRARTLVHLGREEEAIAFLDQAIAQIEAASTCAELLNLRLERGEHPAAALALQRIVERTPLRSRSYERWLECRRSDVAYFSGDSTAAAAHARRSEVPFYVALADRLEGAQATRRVVLPVPFVRQHDKTCAPATLAAICAFHGVEADQLGIAEAICYDGTPEHAERRWAQVRGLAPREFRVTWETAVALIERTLPFTLTMVAPGSGHLVAVAGFDEARGVLLLRDPSSRALTEITREWIDDQRPTGPRGMVLVPPGRRGALDGIDLPDAALHDLYHAVQTGLVDHDRPAAAVAAAELASRAPGHRLALQAERSLARYDGSLERGLQAIDRLLEAFPDDVNLRLARQGALAGLGRRQDRIDWLRAECARSAHPLLSLALGDALQHDARDLREATEIARRLVRSLPWDGPTYHLLGEVLWATDAKEEALYALRVAACLDQTNDHHAQAYFRASRSHSRVQEALGFLRGRFERYGGRSHLPAVTLADALGAVESGAEELEVLELALERRPQDGTLLLHAARAFAVAGHRRRGAELLERARGSAHPADVFRTVALLEELDGNLAAAAEARVRVATLEPLDVGAAEAAARILTETGDRGRAVALLRGAVERFPNHEGLGRALLGWLDQEPPAVREAELRRFIAAAPADAWSRRELALHLSQAGRTEEGVRVLEEAALIEPDSPALHNVRATLLRAAGRVEEARESLRTSLRRDVDQDWAIGELLDLAGDGSVRVAELRFLRGELARQVTFGDAILALQAHGAGVLPAEELLASLREAHAARPDLWHAWVALGRQLLLQGSTDEARVHLEAATRRFPLLPRAWLELGLALRALGDVAGWRRMLERALELNPGWRDATLKLAELLQEIGDFEAARVLLTRALRYGPSDGLLHGWLAEALLALGRTEEAIEELQRALRLEPGYAWALEKLAELGAGRRPLHLELAEELVRERPLDSRVWLMAARVRTGGAGRMAAVDRALELAPTWTEAVRLRMQLFADQGRFDDAIRAMTAPPWRVAPPRILRLEAARLEERRGRTDAALRALEELLEAEPDFLDGWEQLAEWLDAKGRRADCLEAARNLVRLAPLRGASHGWLGLALLASGERAEGTEAVRRAVQLEPGNPWAVRRLFALRLERAEFDAAAELLPLFERHLGKGELHRRRVELAVERGDRREARRAFEELVRCDDRPSVEAGVDALVRATWGDDVEAVLTPMLSGQGGCAAAGHGWYRWAKGALSVWVRNSKLDAAMRGCDRPGPVLAAAVGVFLETMAGRGERGRIRRWVRRHAAKLDGDVTLWGTTAFALCTVGEHRRNLGWMSGWREREGREPWMLVNLEVSLLHRGRLREAAEVGADALGLPQDSTLPRHQAVVAAEAVLRGVAVPPDDFPGRGEELGGVFRWLAAVARALDAAAAGGDASTRWRDVRLQLGEAAAACTLLGEVPGLRRLWWPVLLRVAERLGGGGGSTAWWFLRAFLRALVAR